MIAPDGRQILASLEVLGLRYGGCSRLVGQEVELGHLGVVSSYFAVAPASRSLPLLEEG